MKDNSNKLMKYEDFLPYSVSSRESGYTDFIQLTLLNTDNVDIDSWGKSLETSESGFNSFAHDLTHLTSFFNLEGNTSQTWSERFGSMCQLAESLEPFDISISPSSISTYLPNRTIIFSSYSDNKDGNKNSVLSNHKFRFTIDNLTGAIINIEGYRVNSILKLSMRYSLSLKDPDSNLSESETALVRQSFENLLKNINQKIKSIDFSTFSDDTKLFIIPHIIKFGPDSPFTYMLPLSLLELWNDTRSKSTFDLKNTSSLSFSSYHFVKISLFNYLLTSTAHVRDYTHILDNYLNS